MNTDIISTVESQFLSRQGAILQNTKIPYLLVDNFPYLGMITALRFLEWIQKNPNGVISLPTGKTPEYFIKWTQFFLQNWDSEKASNILIKESTI